MRGLFHLNPSHRPCDACPVTHNAIGSHTARSYSESSESTSHSSSSSPSPPPPPAPPFGRQSAAVFNQRTSFFLLAISKCLRSASRRGRNPFSLWHPNARRTRRGLDLQECTCEWHVCVTHLARAHLVHAPLCDPTDQSRAGAAHHQHEN